MTTPTPRRARRHTAAVLLCGLLMGASWMALPVWASTYTIRGAGSCDEWKADAADRGWALGYISGYNAARGSAITQGMRNEEVVARITEICQADPSQDFDDAMQALIARLERVDKAPNADATAPTPGEGAATRPRPRDGASGQIISLTDLKLDIARMEGQRVTVRAKVATVGGLSMLADPELAFDSNPLVADTEGLPRDDREFLLTRCNRGCTVTVQGIVSEVFFQRGLRLLSLQR